METTFNIVYNSEKETWPGWHDIPEKDSLTIAVLDSSFNPPTLAHKELLVKAATEYSADAYILLFSTKNADKQLTGADTQQRLDMMQKLAITIHEQYNVRNIAVGVTKHARFFEKADEIRAWLRSQNPNRKVQLGFIMGYDTVIRLVDQKYYDQPVVQALQPFFQDNFVICADRAGYMETDIQSFWSSNQVIHLFKDRIRRITIDDKLASISSTQVRSQIQRNDNIDHLVDQSIQQYIWENCIYPTK
jgi:nicotinic acid mononucleotide adenylyltransferase